MTKNLKICAITIAVLSSFILSNCASSVARNDTPNAEYLGPNPTPFIRNAQIAAEPRGNFYYGRRYYVNKTRFWGYLRKPGQQWRSAKLVLMNETSETVPDRLPEDGPAGARYGYDQNYEYRISGSYTGRKAYDPNSNLFLPEFRPTGFTLLEKKPGWIFSTRDFYDPTAFTLRAR
jgi:hypothetical protein